ncbi:extracellular solute-binding protein [Candidatus Gottesmanbacteria bacterium]|nr:extracellular solute-binding protein [Candidatus Gottesmanbacteria bacterium]
MNQSPKEEKPIFTVPEVGSYQDAITNAPQDTSPQLTPPLPPSSPPPPPFEEDNKKKFILIGAGILIFLLIIFFVARFFLMVGENKNQEATLTYWGLWEDENVLKPLIDEYQKSHPNIKIKYAKQNPKEYRERVQAAINRGEGPDIFRFHNTWTKMLQNELSPMPDSIYTKEEFENTFYPVAVKDLTVNESRYGVPLEIDGLVVIYNEDILKAQNLTVPNEWSAFRDVALQLTTSPQGPVVNAGVALGTAENIEHFSDILGLMFLQNGVNLLDPLGPCVDVQNTTCAPDTLRFYRSFAELPTATWDTSFDNSIVAFAGGKVAMIVAPTWQILTIKQINPDINFKIAPVPQLEGITINWATYWVEGVSRASKNQIAAWEFLKFLSSKESMSKLYTEQSKTRPFGEPYSRKDLADTLKSNEYLGALINSAPTMQSFPLAERTLDNGVDDQNIKYLLDSINNMISGTSADSAIQTFSQGSKQVLEKFGYLP